MNKTNTTINIRVDSSTKNKAQKALEEMGMDLSTGIKMFLRNVILIQGLPFEPRTKNGFTLRQEKKMLEETEDAIKKSKRYASAKEIHDSILNS